MKPPHDPRRRPHLRVLLAWMRRSWYPPAPPAGQPPVPVPGPLAADDLRPETVARELAARTRYTEADWAVAARLMWLHGLTARVRTSPDVTGEYTTTATLRL